LLLLRWFSSEKVPDVYTKENAPKIQDDAMSALPPKADIGTQPRDVRFVPKADIWQRKSERFHDGFDALKIYRLVLKKYLPDSFNRSNSLCHSITSSGETSFLFDTKFRMNCAIPLL